MTIAISIKINDGIVLAADSASTVLGLTPNGTLGVLNVYNNVTKVFNLRKGLPIGAITWGAGSIGLASISTIIKDLRQRLSGDDPDHKDWELRRDAYNVEAVANRLKEFVFDDLYSKAFSTVEEKQRPAIGFIVAGYSSNAPSADEFRIDIESGRCQGPRQIRTQDQIGITWAGNAEALNRLIVGASNGLPAALLRLGILQSRVPEAVALVQQTLQVPIVLPAMPLQDAIDLADFMVDLTIKFSRFMPGPPTVGGPIEIAAISKHEGFRWIKRKYYFSRELNPDEKFSRVYEPQDKGHKEEREK